MRKGLFYRLVFFILFLCCLSFLIPSSNAYASQDSFPSYPNLESFSIENSPIESYTTAQTGGLVPSYFFPELQGYKRTTLDDYGPMDMTGGSFNLSGETGPDGNVTGSFNYSGFSERQRANGEFDLYEITAKGQITNAKAAYDDKGFLRIMGAANYEHKHEFSGPVTITMKYSTLVWDEEAEDWFRIAGTVSTQAELAFVSCISDLEDINLCYFEAGKGWGDYGLLAGFISPANDFIWFSNLNFEFGLIAGINFDPEAHHKEKKPDDGGSDEEDKVIFDESYLDAPEKATKIHDNTAASFSLSLSCNDQIYSEDGISCNLNILQSKEDQPYTVSWIVDGYIIKSGTVILNTDNFIFPNPPPGDHSIEVQVINQSTFEARVSATFVEVLMPADLGKIKPWTQAMAGAGSVAILGVWLWSEWAAAKDKQDWFDKWYESAIQEDRSEWFDKQMAINDEYREYRKKIEEKIQAYNKACEDESSRFRNDLIKLTNKYENSDYLIDLYNDMLLDDVYRNGKWDKKQLLRLEEYINIQLKIDREAEKFAKKKRQMDFLNKQQGALNDITYSYPAAGVEIAAGILTGGTSELLFIPMRAGLNAWYAKRRAELLGKTGWNAAKHVMIEAGSRLAVEAIFIEGARVLLSVGGKAVGWTAKKVIGKEGVKKVAKKAAELWALTSKKFAQAPKLNAKLPVIKNYWGKGPKVFVNKPTGQWYKPGPMPRVDFGMDNYLNNRIRPISSQLADDMGHLFREGININPKINNLLKVTDKILLSQSDDIALKLVSNSAYKDAVERGLVPASVQQSVYQARDKLCKRTIRETFKELDKIVLGNKTASSYIKSVAITGTGAKPLSPQAIGRFTDFDSTVIAGKSKMARKAEKMFADTFHKKVSARINTKVAEVKMFPGIHAGELGSNTGGYISEPMLHWHRVDLINRGRSAIRLKNGTIIFDAHPDVVPMKNFGPMTPIRFPNQPSMALADAHSVVTYDVAKTLRETGRALTHEEILIKNGKQVFRAWKAINAGKGLKMPPEIRKLVELKNNPGTRLSPRETTKLWKYFTEYLDLPSNLGARG